MNEGSMKRLSLLCSVGGIAIVYAAALLARPRITQISAIDNTFIGAQVVVSGEVVELRESRDGHLFLKVRDSSGGVISVPVFSKTRAELGSLIEFLDIVEVRGEVKLYNGTLEVVPSSAGDIQVIHTAPALPSQLTEENAGAPAKVSGVVSAKSVVGSGNLLLTLQEDGGKLSVYIPRWIAQNGLQEVHIGDRVVVGGWLQLYDNRLELKVTSASGIRLLEAA